MQPPRSARAKHGCCNEPEIGMDIPIRALITFVIVLLVLYVLHVPIDGRAKRIIRVIVIIIGALSLLSF